MSAKEISRLDKLAREILREDGITSLKQHHNYDSIRKKKNAGYAEYYLNKCCNNLKRTIEADASIYRRLVDIDSKLGTRASQQLFRCLAWTTRWDIIKV